MNSSQILFDIEIQINDFICYHINNYKYVGKAGNQYTVIQSVFSEINQSSEFLNQYIRWYSVILSLVQSYRKYRFQFFRKDIILPGVFPGNAGFWAGERNPGLHKISVIVDSIEEYVTAIARLGLLLSAMKKINLEFGEYKLKHIDSFLEKIVRGMNAGSKDNPIPEVFVLTIKKATDNALKIEASLPGRKKILHHSVYSSLYRNNILQLIKKMPSQTIKNLFNMDDFWNGFIP